MTSASEITKRIEALQSELKDLERKERQEREATIKAFKREWRFTLTKADNQKFMSDEIHDDTLHWYVLRGELLNATDYEAIGGDKERKNGSMRYLYNTLTKRIVMRGGGGNLYVKGEGFGSREYGAQRDRVFAAMAEAIDKGETDVTQLIISQEGFSW